MNPASTILPSGWSSMSRTWLPPRARDGQAPVPVEARIRRAVRVQAHDDRRLGARAGVPGGEDLAVGLKGDRLSAFDRAEVERHRTGPVEAASGSPVAIRRVTTRSFPTPPWPTVTILRSGWTSTSVAPSMPPYSKRLRAGEPEPVVRSAVRQQARDQPSLSTRPTCPPATILPSGANATPWPVSTPPGRRTSCRRQRSRCRGSRRY